MELTTTRGKNMRFFENLLSMIGYGIMACIGFYMLVVLPSPAGQREYHKVTTEVKHSFNEARDQFYADMKLY